MSASDLIAVGSLALAAITVVVSYLNSRHQTTAAMQLEHIKWLREKRDALYGQLLTAADTSRDEIDEDDDSGNRPFLARARQQQRDLREVAMRYASDAVLADTNNLGDKLDHWYAKELDVATVTTSTTFDDVRAVISDYYDAVDALREDIRFELAYGRDASGRSPMARKWRRG